MVRNFFVLLFMLFSFSNALPDKKYITTSQGVTAEELFIPNTHLPAVTKEEPISKGSKKLKKSSYKRSPELEAVLTDIPVCVDAYNKELNTVSPEMRYEFKSNQSIDSLQQLYVSELTRFGWNVEIISVLKEVILLGIKPRKKVLIVLNKIEGGWFSKAVSHVIIVIKEQ